MKYTFLLVALSCFISLPTLAADAGSTSNITLTVTPQNKSGNGFEAKIPFSYVFRNCYGELHLNIGKKKNQGLKYHYKGKTYWPGFFGKQSFESAPVGLITLNADVYDKGVRKGNIRMYNVTLSNGAGCFGQVYKVDSKVGVDAKEAAKRAEDFSLSNITIEASGSTDYGLEKVIIASLKEQEEKEKAAAAPSPSPAPADGKVAGTAAGVAGAAGAAATGAGAKTGSTATTGTTKTGAKTSTQKPTAAQTSAAKQGPSDYEKRQKVAQDLDKFQKSQDAKMKATDREFKKASKKVTTAATNFYKGWQGSGTSIGFSMRMNFDPPEEQDPYWLGMTFGKLWDPSNPRNGNKWISGFETEFAFNSEWLGDSLLTCAYTCRDSNWERYNMGFFVNLVGNISFLKAFQPYIGIGWVEKETFNTKDESLDKEFTFVRDLGLAINISGAFLIKLGSNSDMDTFTIGASFMSR